MLKTIKGMFTGRRAAPATPPPAPARADTPFRLRPGAPVTLDPLGQARLADTAPDRAMPIPADTLWVSSHGWIHDAGFTVHRFYADETTEAQQPSWMLQAVADAQGRTLPDEIVLWHVSERIFPGTSDDWRVWLDETDGASGLIGWPVFDCQASGHRYDRVDDMVETFRHTIEIDGTPDHAAAPRTLLETVRRDGRPDTSTTTQTLRRMLYGRPLGPDAPIELALLEAVDAGTAGAWIRILKGVELNARDVGIL